jgi:hypothetical protein
MALDLVIAGHVADGNVHAVVPVAPHDTARAHAFSDRLVEHALSVGGTATGEHGIGVTKRKYLRAEHGGAVEVMAAIKATLDPAGVLNPGKILAGPERRNGFVTVGNVDVTVGDSRGNTRRVDSQPTRHLARRV